MSLLTFTICRKAGPRWSPSTPTVYVMNGREVSARKRRESTSYGTRKGRPAAFRPGCCGAKHWPRAAELSSCSQLAAVRDSVYDVTNRRLASRFIKASHSHGVMLRVK
jgi:hypothetical protein